MKHARIVSDPDVMFGKPTIKGTRVPVERILRKLAAGQTVEAIIETFPRLTVDDVRAAAAYAADVIAREDITFADAA